MARKEPTLGNLDDLFSDRPSASATKAEAPAELTPSAPSVAQPSPTAQISSATSAPSDAIADTSSTNTTEFLPPNSTVAATDSAATGTASASEAEQALAPSSDSAAAPTSHAALSQDALQATSTAVEEAAVNDESNSLVAPVNMPAQTPPPAPTVSVQMAPGPGPAQAPLVFAGDEGITEVTTPTEPNTVSESAMRAQQPARPSNLGSSPSVDAALASKVVTMTDAAALAKIPANTPNGLVPQTAAAVVAAVVISTSAPASVSPAIKLSQALTRASAFGLRGRVRRIRFITTSALGLLLISSIALPSYWLMQQALAGEALIRFGCLAVVAAFGLWLVISASVRRIHDLGFKAWWLVFPGLNVLALAAMLMIPGSAYSNSFGLPIKRNSLFEWLAFFTFVLLPIGSLPAASIMFQAEIAALIS